MKTTESLPELTGDMANLLRHVSVLIERSEQRACATFGDMAREMAGFRHETNDRLVRIESATKGALDQIEAGLEQPRGWTWGDERAKPSARGVRS